MATATKRTKKYTGKKGNSNKDLAYQIVTDRMIGLIEKAIENGSTLAPWHKPWSDAGAPRNLVSNKPYRGVNALLTGLAEFSSPYWATWKQIAEKGGKVKEDQQKNSTILVFFKWIDIKAKSADEDDRRIPLLKYFRVYNLDQTEGVKVPKRATDEPKEDIDPIGEAEEILSAMKNACQVNHGGNRAYYMPSQDRIQMPNMNDFDNAEAYYSTRFHETVHSTGHKSRLNRPGIVDCTTFGDTNYSKEELVAEMGAAFLCSIVGIENGTVDNSAAYLKGWLSKLKNDKKLFVQAAGLAQKAVDHILGTTFDN